MRGWAEVQGLLAWFEGLYWERALGKYVKFSAKTQLKKTSP